MTRSIFENKKRHSHFSNTLLFFYGGSAFPSLKVGYDILDLNNQTYLYKVLFAGYRFLLASLMILTYGTLKGMLVPLSKRILGHLAVLGILQTSLTYILFYIGLSNTTGVKGSILIGTGTFFAIIFAHFYYHDDKLSLNKILGLVVGFIGVIIISLSKGSLDFGFKFTGEGFMIISSMVTAVASLYAKELSKKSVQL